MVQEIPPSLVATNVGTAAFLYLIDTRPGFKTGLARGLLGALPPEWLLRFALLVVGLWRGLHLLAIGLNLYTMFGAATRYTHSPLLAVHLAVSVWVLSFFWRQLVRGPQLDEEG